MNNEQKAEKYNQLMYEYTKTQNKISSIKGESLNLNESQLKEIKFLEGKLELIMRTASFL
jgi:hypothetical protein